MTTSLQIRFSLEQLQDSRFVLVDWAYGLVAGAGHGLRAQQERLRLQAIRACGMRGNCYLPGLVGQNPLGPNAWPGGHPPPERTGWVLEQRAIQRAYSQIGEVLRRRKIPANLAGMDPDVVMAVRHAERLRHAALAKIGLEFAGILDT